jgi:hypothetical protein
MTDETTETPPADTPPVEAPPVETPPADEQAAPPKSAINSSEEEGKGEVVNALAGEDLTPTFISELKDENGTAVFTEDYTFDEETSKNFVELVNGADSKEALATGLLNMFKQQTTTLLEQAGKTFAEEFNQLQETRVEEIKSDPVYGGANQAKALAEAKRIVTTFGGQEALELLDSTGFGNDILAVRLFNKIAEQLPPEPGHVSGTPPNEKKSLASRLGVSVNQG